MVRALVNSLPTRVEVKDKITSKELVDRTLANVVLVVAGITTAATVIRTQNAGRKCGKIGHITRCCSRNTRKDYATNLVDEDYYYDSSDDAQYSLLHMNYAEGSAHVYRITDGSDKYQVSVKANGHHILKMELDTGSVVSIVNETTYREKFSDRSSRRTNLKLQGYNKAPVAVLGVIDVPVVYKSQRATLPLVMTQGDVPNLFGRNWLSKLKLDWNELVQQTKKGEKVCRVDDPTSELDDILSHYDKAVFTEGIKTFKYFKPQIHVKRDSVPIF